MKVKLFAYARAYVISWLTVRYVDRMCYEEAGACTQYRRFSARSYV